MKRIVSLVVVALLFCLTAPAVEAGRCPGGVCPTRPVAQPLTGVQPLVGVQPVAKKVDVQVRVRVSKPTQQLTRRQQRQQRRAGR